jgi:hypothetical protein
MLLQWLLILAVCVVGNSLDRMMSAETDIRDDHPSFSDAAEQNSSSNIISTGTKMYRDQNNKLRGIRYYYYYLSDNHTTSHPVDCDHWTVFYMGVGTAMTMNDYEQMSHQIVLQQSTGSNTLVIIADHNVHQIVKYQSEDYTSLANQVYQDIGNLIPSRLLFEKQSNNKAFECHPRVILGGHSASGRAALLSYQSGELDFRPVGFLGLDPWWICPTDHPPPTQSSSNPNTTRTKDIKHVTSLSSICKSTQQQQTRETIQTIQIPTLSIGFTDMTCGVDPQLASMAVYQKTVPQHRVWYQIHNGNNDDPSTSIPSNRTIAQKQHHQHSHSIRHCSFTDTGCPGFTVFGIAVGCPMMESYEFIYQLVGYAAKKFAMAIQQDHDSFDRKQFDISSFLSPKNVTLYVGNDDTPEFSSSLRGLSQEMDQQQPK